MSSFRTYLRPPSALIYIFLGFPEVQACYGRIKIHCEKSYILGCGGKI